MKSLRAQSCLFSVLLATPLSAQQNSAPALPPAVAPDAYRVLQPVKLYPGVAQGSESWTIPESTAGQPPSRVVRNVVSPDYVPYLPAKGYRPELHWIDEFFWWMEANGLARKPGDPEPDPRTRRPID